MSSPPRTAGLKVVSLNMAREVRVDAILRDLQPGDADSPADVWLLQEAAERSSPTIAALANALNLHYVFAPADRLDQ